MFRILAVDDEKKLRETICDYMTAKGFIVDTAENGDKAVEMAEINNYDLIILDVMMPVKNGLDACAEIRQFCDTPILFLSALGEEADYLRAYQNGCDDYIVKPFPLSVLCEKCRSIIARSKGLGKENRKTIGDICIDYSRRIVFVCKNEISLAPKDFEILSYLAENKGIAINRELILSRIWGYDFEGDIRVVDTHIKKIRKALGDASGYIKTVSGIGYSFEEV